MKSINLWENGLSDGRYVQVTIDKATSQIEVRAVYITGFRREPYEKNGAQCLSFLVSSLQADDMQTPLGEPVQERILLGQVPSRPETLRYFPLRVMEFYLKLCSFEDKDKGGEAFRIWNEEHHKGQDEKSQTTNEYKSRPATLMTPHPS